MKPLSNCEPAKIGQFELSERNSISIQEKLKAQLKVGLNSREGNKKPNEEGVDEIWADSDQWMKYGQKEWMK